MNLLASGRVIGRLLPWGYLTALALARQGLSEAPATQSAPEPCGGVVVSADRERKGLVGEVVVTRCTNHRSDSVRTTATGEFIVDKSDCLPCGRLSLLAKPDSDEYLVGVGEVKCNSTFVLISCVPKHKIEQELEAARKKGEWGRVAVITNDFLVREHIKKSVKADPELERSLFQSVARSLGVEGTDATYFDPNQNKLVMSPALGDAVMSFQAKQGLEPNGRLDFKTLKGMAEKDVKGGAVGPAPLFVVEPRS